MNTTPEDLLPILQNMADNMGRYALVLATVATIVMALVELAKAISYVRPRYHKARVLEFLRADAVAELLRLIVGGVTTQNAVYDQPTDKMMGQIGAAAKMALDFPNKYPYLYAALTREDQDDAAVWKALAEALDNPHVDATGLIADPPDDVQRRATRARARIDQSVSRKLDAFQLRTEYVWARCNQAVAVGGAILFLALLLRPVFIENPITYVFSCIVGGLMSPVAKDVVTALSGLRTRS
jgi:hypothetical protein